MYSFRRSREAILTAPDERAIRSKLLECVSEIRTEISILPPDCQEALADADADLNSVAMTLLHADMAFKGEPEAAKLLRDLANVYAAASVRLTQIHSRHQPAQ